jgi:hypothetical protein
MKRNKQLKKLRKRKLYLQLARRSASNYREEKDLLSHHVFLLPFRWDKVGEQAYDVAQFKELVATQLDKPKAARWEESRFSQKRIVDYNEYHYFYEYVTEVLYSKEKPAAQTDKDELFIAHYRYQIKPGSGSYVIRTPDPYRKGKDKDYVLEIDSILLHLYYTGVGILSFHLNNRRADQSRPKDILNINQYGRRVFPNFFPIPSHKVGFQSAFDETDSITNDPRGMELAKAITIHLGENTIPSERKKSLVEAKTKYVHDYEVFSEIWCGGIPGQLKSPDNTFHFRMPRFLEPFIGFLEDDFIVKPVLDDRMYVMCWYGHDSYADHLSKFNKEVPNYLLDDWWYRYAFVDGAGMRTVQDETMQKEASKRATYTRWSDWQTLYGASEYSMVLLTNTLPSLRDKGAAFLVTHFQTIYFRLAELVLLQRASVQRFSDDVTHIARLDGADGVNGKKEKPTQADLARRLYRRYLRFVNRIYFREATPQQQGIDLYELLQKAARVPEQVTALQQEIERLQAYVQQETDRRQQEIEKRNADLLALLGALFLAPGLLIAVYDLGVFGDCLEQEKLWFYGIALAGGIIAGLLGWLVFKPIDHIPKENRPWLKRNRWPVAATLYALLLLLPLFVCAFMGEATDAAATPKTSTSTTTSEAAEKGMLMKQQTEDSSRQQTLDSLLIQPPTAPASAPNK